MHELRLQDQKDRTRVLVVVYYVLTFHVFGQMVYMYVKMDVYLVKANLETIGVFRDSYITGCVCVPVGKRSRLVPFSHTT